MSKEKLSANDIRNLDKDTYIVVKLHEDEYWMQGEGRVSFVKEYDSGNVEVGLRGSSGHMNYLKVPSDAREGLRMDGAASGANNLKVTSVYRK
jgi:hypothetical protein